ncbi:haloacid dehalogenase [Cylindrobasidium torrendii FP15055 ss-10]|uniref:Haloacid dehalogenase n=1 Tax=Cylindrobasidium torrendii FP15055 ss-10 TaxID=1314674 RepID=A0A0D7BVI0_9AGAR|nr:haloacid dehalogenase [Cylindrobasidium torrendii FP15055 ss-10]
MTTTLEGIEVLFFDVFGTVVDWRSSVVRELTDLGASLSLSYSDSDWEEFTLEWRRAYLTATKRVGNGSGTANLNVDEMNRENLDKMLSSERWAQLREKLSPEQTAHLNLVWRRLHGWPDSVEGLERLEQKVIIVALSNGNVRLLTEMAKFAGLPWNVIFSAGLFDSYKPDPLVYQRAMKHLSVKPENCAMVAAHDWDIIAAAKQGMKTVYVHRPEEGDVPEVTVRTKQDGGDADFIVHSFLELADLLK